MRNDKDVDGVRWAEATGGCPAAVRSGVRVTQEGAGAASICDREAKAGIRYREKACISSETVDNFHVHEGSTTVTGSSSEAVDGVLMYEGDAAVGGGEDKDSNSKKVTFAEPGKVHEKDSSVGELGNLSDGGSGENCTTGVTTSKSLSGGICDSGTTMVTTQISGLISSSDVRWLPQGQPP